MNLILLLVDDKKTNLASIASLARNVGFSPVCFELPREAHRYLAGCDAAPAAYLIDMQIPIDREGSDRLFYHVRDVCEFPVDHFYFMTGTLSSHDRDVVERTGAKYVLKTNLGEEFFLGILWQLESELPHL